MKNRLKKFLSGAVCFALAVSIAAMTGCGGGKGEKDDSPVLDVGEVVFPLKEAVKLTFMVSGSETTTFKNQLESNKLWQKLKADTNVDISFMFLGDDPTAKLSSMTGARTYGDVLFGGPIINSFTASMYINAGMMQDLKPFITEKLTPNLYAVLQDKPAAWDMITALDGKVYTLPRITDIEGWSLESPIWINKKWLDKLGLKVPTTLNEFTNVLRAFLERDPNGNGEADEIPYLASASHSYMNLEALLGMWGLSTKSGDLDAFVQVRGGKVQFVPATDAYKEALKWYKTLYSEGLLWSECFNANLDSTMSKFNSPTCVVGCFTYNQKPYTSYADDYICIRPPKVDGYDPAWWYHPAINGSNNQFFITDNCKNAAVAMKWMDQFYSTDIAMAADYGLPGEDGRIEKGDDGKYTYVDLTPEEQAKMNLNNPPLTTLLGNFPRALTKKAFETNVTYSREQQVMQDCYDTYKDIIITELWPRPYFEAKDATTASGLTTMIFNTVTTQRAKWVTGEGDIDGEWNDYIKRLQDCRLDEFTAILQRAYDSYSANTGK